MFIYENDYADQMKKKAEPYLDKHLSEGWLDLEGRRGIYYVRYAADHPVGILMISHGFTETADKYHELAYYFVLSGYTVYAWDHIGHGRSTRLVEDLSLVHVDDFFTYAQDLLAIAHLAMETDPDLPIYLFGHSMGGGIAATAVSLEPGTFSKLILSSPMIRPETDPIPWSAAKAAVRLNCRLGKKENYIPGQKPYEDNETFEESAATSEERFAYYHRKRQANELFQTCAGTNGWLLEVARMEQYLMTTGWQNIHIPTILFQAENDTFVCGDEQEQFVKKIHKKTPGLIKLIRVPDAKHEIFFSPDDILHQYVAKILSFLQ